MGEELEIEVAGESIILMASGAAYWPRKNSLFIADLHLGKANHFRKAGIPIPLNLQYDNLKKLESELTRSKCREVYFLGDLFHSEWNKSWEVFSQFCEKRYDINFHLVLGNHDILNIEQYLRAGLKVHHEGVLLEPFQLFHHPQDGSDYYRFCGHVHPAVRLKGRGRQSLRLPCFWKKKEELVFPSFGGFTGSVTVSPQNGDEIYVVTKEGPVKIEG